MRKICFVFLILLICIFCIACAMPAFVAAAEDLSYLNTLDISRTETGYRYGNNGEYVTKDTLQEIFDDIEQHVSGNAKIRFVDNFQTDEALVLDYTHVFVLSGNVTYMGTNTFLTVQSGTMRIQGLILHSYVGVIAVEPEATLEIVSGTITTASDGNSITVQNRGTAVISGGSINNVPTREGIYGLALYQGDGELRLSDSVLEGRSAVAISGGTATIDNTTLKANGYYVDSTENGYALRVSNSGVVTFNSGKMTSVEPERTVLLSGNASSALYWNGGNVDGYIAYDLVNTVQSTYLYVGEKTIRGSFNGRVYLFSDDLMTCDNAHLGVIPREGYHWVRWSGGIEEEQPALASFGTEPIVVTMSNVYTLRFVIAEDEYSGSWQYGESVDPYAQFDIVVPEGYAVVNWLGEDGSSYDIPFSVAKADVVTAVLAIADFDVEIGDGRSIDAVYNGEEIVLAPSFDHNDVFTYTYVWEKEYFGNVSTLAEFAVRTVSDSGRYRVSVTASDGERSTTAIGQWLSVTIAKGVYQNVGHPALSGTYSPTQWLASFDLEDGFAWVEPLTVPTVDQTAYAAIYCDDYDNYLPCEVNVTLILAKAIAPVVYHNPISGNFVYSPAMTLADYAGELSADWRWMDDSIVPHAGNAAYLACYNPDVVNYDDFIYGVSLSIAKADYLSAEDFVVTIPYREGLTIDAVLVQNEAADNGYRLRDTDIAGNTVLSKPAVYVYKIAYNADTDNYNDFEVDLTITVIKGVVAYEHPAVQAVYTSGLRLGDIDLGRGWSWEEDVALSIGTYAFWALYNPDPECYSDYRTQIVVTVDDEDQPTHPRCETVYHRGLTLGDVVLQEGFVWAQPELELQAGEAFYDAYRRMEGMQDIALRIEVSVSPQVVTTDGLMFEDETVAYDGKPHTIAYGGSLAEGVFIKGYVGTEAYTAIGTYTITITFGHVDPVNYVAPQDVSATLTIIRGTYDMSRFAWEDKRVTYDGKAHTIEPQGTLPEGVTIARYSQEEGCIRAGTYRIEVFFAQEDEENYYPVSSRVATLYIDKASSPIQGTTTQVFIYDGATHRPNVLVATTEQELLCDDMNSYSLEGEYTYHFSTVESVNYLAGEKTVLMRILAQTKIAEGDTHGLITSEHGLSGTAVLTWETEDENAASRVLNVTLSGGSNNVGPFTVCVELPKAMRGADITVTTADGKEVPGKWENGVFSFDTPTLGKFTLTAAEGWQSNRNLPVWAIILIVIADIIALGVAVFVVVSLKRKAKSKHSKRGKKK